MISGVRLMVAALLGAATLAGCDGSASKMSEGAAALPETAAGEAPRCLEKEELQSVARMAAPELQRDVLVLLDQTTEFPEDVRQSIIDQVTALADPGTRISVGTFSTYTQSQHSQIVFESLIEPSFPSDRRGDAPMKALRRLNACFEDRSAAESERLRAALEEAFSGSGSEVQRSDLLANLKDFGSRLTETGAADRILVVASDMLENSSTISFYGNGRMRTIDPEAELSKAEEADLIGEMPRARVFVIGAGLLPSANDSYRTVEEVDALKRFWKQYFELSGAASVVIGTPRLHRRIG